MLYAGAHTPASAFPQPVLTHRSEEQQKQFDDMFTQLDQNLRREFATLADTEKMAMQSPREKIPQCRKNNKSKKKESQAEKIAKLNAAEEELQKEAEEKKKKREQEEQQEENQNDETEDEEEEDDETHEIGKKHQSAQRSYKNLAQAFDEFVGL